MDGDSRGGLTVSLEVVDEEGLLLSALHCHQVTAVLHTLLLSHLPLGLFPHVLVAAQSKLLIGGWAAGSHSHSGLCQREKTTA